MRREICMRSRAAAEIRKPFPISRTWMCYMGCSGVGGQRLRHGVWRVREPIRCDYSFEVGLKRQNRDKQLRRWHYKGASKSPYGTALLLWHCGFRSVIVYISFSHPLVLFISRQFLSSSPVLLLQELRGKINCLKSSILASQLLRF
jgi:hypothetical protein